MNRERTFTYIGFAAIALLLFGLMGWYFFLRSQTSSVEDAAAGRGFSIGIPSFLGSRGSTAANTEGSAVGAESGEFGAGGSAFLQLLGIGRGTLNTPQQPTTQTGTTSSETKPQTPRFWRVSIAPIAGAAFTSASSSMLRYVERATGYVIDVDPRTGEIKRLTNTLIPKVYDAHIGNGVFVLRTFDEAPSTLRATIGSTTDGVSELITSNLGATIREVETDPSSRDILAIAGTPQAELLHFTSNTLSQRVLSIPGGEFMIARTLNPILVEKAASGIMGSAFRTTPFTTLIQDVAGLTILAHPTSDALVYGSDDGKRLRLFARAAGGTAQEISVATVADKCVWGKGSTAYCGVPQSDTGENFLNRWYRGETHADDAWYTIDTAAATAEKLFTMDSGLGIDVERPTIDSAGEYIAFINARDKSLWLLRITP